MTQVSRPGFNGPELIEHVPALRGFARRFYSSPTDIDDLVQETLTKALVSADKFRQGTRLRAWLFTIMRNTFYSSYARSRREDIGIDDVNGQWAAMLPSQELHIYARDFEKALSDLPEQFRTAFDLIFIEGASYQEAADRCGCALGTMKSRVSRSRSHLAHILEA